MDEQYLIHEVAEKAGVSTRTIRYYISEGLLPAPTSRGRYAYYDPAYIDLIQLIRQLKENYLPLREIKLLVQDITPERIQELLQSSARMKKLQQESGMNRVPAEDEELDMSSAIGYIDHLRQEQLAENKAGRRTVHASFIPGDPDLELPPEKSNRQDIEKPAFTRKPVLQETMDKRMPFQPDIHEDDHELPAFNRRIVQENTDTGAWRRYSIVEGVELNIRDDAIKRAGGKLADIIHTIRQLFKLI